MKHLANPCDQHEPVVKSHGEVLDKLTFLCQVKVSFLVFIMDPLNCHWSYNACVFFPLSYSKECLVSSSGNDNTENGLPGSKADSKPTPKAWKQHVCVHIWAYVYMHNSNRLKESHNDGQFYYLSHEKNAIYKYVKIYMKYILDCAWGNIQSAAGWITPFSWTETA